jgi:NAD(P)H dehydrogenase (quinone)
MFNRAAQPKDAMKDIPTITPEIRKQVIKSADAIVFGSPTRFGSMTAQMKMFFDGLGGLWFENACVGKIASCFSGSGTQHGGNETTIMSMLAPLLHLGFMYVGLPYSCKEQKEINEVSGGSPYGATFIAGSDGSRAVSANEKACARFQGKHVASIAKELKAGRVALHGEVAEEDEAVAKDTKGKETAPEDEKSGEDKKKAKKSEKTDGKKKTDDAKAKDGEKKKTKKESSKPKDGEKKKAKKEEKKTKA